MKYGPIGHVNPIKDIEIMSLYLSSRLPAIKGPPTLQAGGHKNIFPLLHSELLELLAHPIVTLFFFFNTKTLDIGLLSRSMGLKQDKL
jgi:hypothetical protein